MISEDMYKEHILDLYKNPHNFGHLETCTHKHREYNPLCGDDITIEVSVKEGKIEKVKFSGRGCTISMAAASMLTDKIKGMSKEDLMKLDKEDVLGWMRIPISPVRLKCALLCLETLHKAVNNDA